MIVDTIKHEKTRAKVRRNFLKHILNWGENNDYPQSVIDIVSGSIKGSACLDTYKKFIFGKGFKDADNYQIVINEDGDTADDLLRAISEDYARFGGFAIHLNRNILGRIVSMRHIPMENVRFCDDKNEEYAGKVALHPDWGERGYKRFNETPIEYIDIFTPDIHSFRERVAKVGGIWNYQGEVYIYSNRKGNYPLPKYDAALTCMATEEAVDNITYRNAKRGFLPAGCFAEIDEYFDPNNEQDKERFDAFGKALKDMQGDTNAAALMHCIVKDKESLPQFISMKADNYDKEYTITRESTANRIGEAFSQPKELRGEESSSGFADDKMVQAYNVYNSATAEERLVLESELTALFKNWWDALEYNFEIEPLTYAAETILTRLGENTTKELIALVTNGSISTEQKKHICITIFGLSENEANDILNIQNPQV